MARIARIASGACQRPEWAKAASWARFGLAFTLAILFANPGKAQIDFARDVLPILSDKCFHCHGPDEKARKASLRLDAQAGAFRTKNGITTIVPGKPGESEVIRRVLSKDADEMMPPQDSNRKLTDKQKAILKQWVADGAKWGKHWAYEPLPRIIPIPPGDPNPIDAFIRARLKKEGLVPSLPATKEAWLRRVSLDLTGLPPTPAELDAFAKDDSPQAFEKVVDRLLASPRYGERMASDWLDLARYADTNGYQADRAVPVWPYRDWVIHAFNRNQHFDAFLTEQLAGDLLPKATQPQKLATAFNRLHMQNEEGGIVEEEFRVAYVVDRVNTFGTAFLGQTFECTRCHDHKYDPLTQKDYYSLFAFFQNIDESGQTSYFTNSLNTPTLLLTTPEQEEKIEQLKLAVKDAEANLKRAKSTGREDYDNWKKEKHEATLFDDWQANYHFDEQIKKQIKNSVNEKLPGVMHDRVEFIEGWKDKAGKPVHAASLNGENGFEFPGIGHFTKSDPFSIIITFKYEFALPRAVILHHSKAPVDAGSRGYELLLENGHVAFGLHHMWPGNSIKVVTKKPLEKDKWHRLIVTYDGSGKAEGIHIRNDSADHPVDVVQDNLTKDITYDGEEPKLALGYRFRDNGFKGGVVHSLSIIPRVATEYELYLTYGGSFVMQMLSDDGMNYAHYLATSDKHTLKRTAELRDARRELAKYIEPIPEAMVMDELPTPKPAFILKRGAYDSHGERVSANTPQSLPPFPANEPRNRLGLAHWLTQPDHPLTARVTVNRLWQQMFGRGIVETSDNFGTTGTPPTHPELLDWLARDFVDHAWDVKRTLKQIALSATYRQSSRTTNEVRAKDPFNQWLSHAPVRRLTAEMLRDQALYASGLLMEKLGGPSVFPYQPEGLWNDAMGRPHYPQSKGVDLYRRSLYTHWKRTAPPPTMTTFDAADRSICSVRRQATSTPLQALVLLNDPQYVEAARFLAERMMKENTIEDRIAFGFRTVLNRKPRDAEIKILTTLFDEQKAIFANAPINAEKLLAIGEKKRDNKLDASEHAALTQLALTLLNHDEVVQRR